MLAYCEAMDAQLIVIPYRYRNPNSVFADKDYEFDEGDAFAVELDGNGGWEAVGARFNPIGAVIGPRAVMRQLAADLKLGRVKL